VRIREIALCLLLLFGFAAALPAQEITGNISGTVTDTSAAAVPDAKVDLSNVLTGAERSTTTTSAGIFFFTSLPVGDYTLIVSKDGFKKSEVTGIHVNVNDKLTFSVKLGLGAVTESDKPLLFTDVSYASRVAPVSTPYVGWGTGFFDYDNDGWPDILAVNGHVYPQMENASVGTTYRQRMLLFHNEHNGTFVEVAAESAAALITPRVSRGAAFGDLDNDGYIDVVINNLDGKPTILRNDGGAATTGSPLSSWGAARIATPSVRASRSSAASSPSGMKFMPAAAISLPMICASTTACKKRRKST
jgi:hypothetical protein